MFCAYGLAFWFGARMIIEDDFTVQALTYGTFRSEVNASIFDSGLVILVARTRRKKEKKVACPLLDVFAFGQVSTPRLYRLNHLFFNFDFCYRLNQKNE